MNACRDFDRAEPNERNGFQRGHAALILSSHQQLVGRPLLDASPDTPPADLARLLYHAPAVVLAHDGAADPVFFYANLAAQRLFEMPWRVIVRLPSRHSAEPVERAERERLLTRVARQGFIDDYVGVRVSSGGRRFRVVGATVWNLIGMDGPVIGQAASFATWETLAPFTA